MEEQVLSFELTASEANIVLNGLGKVAAEATSIISKMQKQAAGQLSQEAQEPAEAA